MTPHRPAPLLHARQDGGLTLATVLATHLSEANAEELSEELSRLLGGAARPRLRLDLARVRFLTSTVLGKLVALHKRVRAAGGELVLLNVAGVVYEVFEVTRLDQLLDVRRPGPEDCPPIATPPPRENAMFRGYAKCGCPIFDDGVFHELATCTNLARNRVPVPAKPVCKSCERTYEPQRGNTVCPYCGKPVEGTS
jgi:anti-sigma B factor antagonist